MLCVEEASGSPVSAWEALTCCRFFACRPSQCESLCQPLWNERCIWGNLSWCTSGGISFLWGPVWHHDQSTGKGHGYPHGLEQSERRGSLPSCHHSYLWPQVRHPEALSSSLVQTVCRDQCVFALTPTQPVVASGPSRVASSWPDMLVPPNLEIRSRRRYSSICCQRAWSSSLWL